MCERCVMLTLDLMHHSASLDHWVCLEEKVCDVTDQHTSVQSPKPAHVSVDRISVRGGLQKCWTGLEEAVLFSF